MTSTDDPEEAERRRLLAAYDAELRTDAETPGALRVERCGPLRLVTFPGGRGFVTYRDLGARPDARAVTDLVAAALAQYRADPAITTVEWKARAHDRAPGLDAALRAHGFMPEEPESIMIGPLTGLVVETPLPPGVRLRRLREEADVRAMSAMADRGFGEEPDARRADALVARLAREKGRDRDGMQLWVAEADGQMVSAGRLEPVPGTRFVGLWGGVTLPAWRGRGIYRALTAARARSALAAGFTLVHSDSTEHSRPILERAGLRRVSATTPYTWRR